MGFEKLSWMNIAISENNPRNRAGNSVLAEELIVQNNKMSELYPGSINTVRIVTFLQKDLREVSFLFSSVRIGNGG